MMADGHNTLSSAGARAVAIPRLLRIADGALARLAADVLETFAPESVLIVSGPNASREVADELASTIGTVDSHEIVADGTTAEARRVADAVDKFGPSVVIAVGGGKTIDVAKLGASRSAHVIAVPTVLSHDGMASPVSSLIDDQGQRQSIGVGMPSGVVIDLGVIANSPIRFLRAGVGDLLSNLTAVDDWRAATTDQGEDFDEFAASIAVLSAKAALEVSDLRSLADLDVVARGLVMSGLAMEVAGSSRPCSGAEHLISHALDRVRGPAAGLHGEHVAIGVLVSSYLQDSPHRPAIRALCRRVGIPLTLREWGLDPTVLVQAIRLAPSTRPGRYTLLSDMNLTDDDLTPLVLAAFADGAVV